jgi:hypothetical protein
MLRVAGSRRHPGWTVHGRPPGDRDNGDLAPRGLTQTGGSMARRPNYGFEKRQKELDKQKKKEEKAAKKEQRKLLEAAGGEGEILQGDEDLEGSDDGDGDEDEE